MEKALPPKVSAESRGSKENPDPNFFVEFEGDEGPEFVPFTILHAEAANRQADLMEAALPILERIAVALEKTSALQEETRREFSMVIEGSSIPGADMASDGPEIFGDKP